MIKHQLVTGTVHSYHMPMCTLWYAMVAAAGGGQKQRELRSRDHEIRDDDDERAPCDPVLLRTRGGVSLRCGGAGR